MSHNFFDEEYEEEIFVKISKKRKMQTSKLTEKEKARKEKMQRRELEVSQVREELQE